MHAPSRGACLSKKLPREWFCPSACSMLKFPLRAFDAPSVHGYYAKSCRCSCDPAPCGPVCRWRGSRPSCNVIADQCTHVHRWSMLRAPSTGHLCLARRCAALPHPSLDPGLRSAPLKLRQSVRRTLTSLQSSCARLCSTTGIQAQGTATSRRGPNSPR